MQYGNTSPMPLTKLMQKRYWAADFNAGSMHLTVSAGGASVNCPVGLDDMDFYEAAKRFVRQYEARQRAKQEVPA